MYQKITMQEDVSQIVEIAAAAVVAVEVVVR